MSLSESPTASFSLPGIAPVPSYVLSAVSITRSLSQCSILDHFGFPMPNKQGQLCSFEVHRRLKLTQTDPCKATVPFQSVICFAIHRLSSWVVPSNQLLDMRFLEMSAVVFVQECVIRCPSNIAGHLTVGKERLLGSQMTLSLASFRGKRISIW